MLNRDKRQFKMPNYHLTVCTLINVIRTRDQHLLLRGGIGF